MEGTSPVFIDSDYEYVLGMVGGNVLNLQAAFNEMSWARSDLLLIARELENTGRLFATKQGFGSANYQVIDHSINGKQVVINKNGRTGNLLNSIHANVIGNEQIDFYNNAQNSRGQFYAGHLEYGFRLRNGQMYPARPFMRPALHAVAEASQGNLKGTLYRFLDQNLVNLGATQLSFGTPTTAKGNLRAFYNQTTVGRGARSGFYTTRGLANNIAGKGNRQSHWSKISNLSNKGHYSKSFIGKGNNRQYRQGTKTTGSTIKYRDNRKFPGSKMKSSTSTTKSQKSLTKRNFGTKQTISGHRWQTTDGQQSKSRSKAEEAQWKIDKTANVKRVPVYQQKTTYSKSKTTYKVTTKKRK